MSLFKVWRHNCKIGDSSGGKYIFPFFFFGCCFVTAKQLMLSYKVEFVLQPPPLNY
jgi:hypothetical protein